MFITFCTFISKRAVNASVFRNKAQHLVINLLHFATLLSDEAYHCSIVTSVKALKTSAHSFGKKNQQITTPYLKLE